MQPSTSLTPLPQPPADLTSLGTADLLRELAVQLRHTAESMMRLAWIVRILEERGEDLSGLRLPLINHLRRIAHGQVLPELVVRFAAQPGLLNRVALLPMPDQQRLAAGDSVKLVVLRETADGRRETDHRLVDPSKLTQDQIWQVFGQDRIRSEAEQVLYLEDKTMRPTTSPQPRGRVRPDVSRGGLIVNRSFVSRGEIIHALAGLRGESADAGELEASLLVQLTAEEHRKIKVAAAQSDTTMAALARDALRAAGLI